MRYLIIYFLLINLGGIFAFALDKYKAIHNRWRIRESVLFLFALLGGAPGCLLGMYAFHHKTRHKKFTIGIRLILILELTGLIFLFIYMEKQIPYDQDPVKLVRHELSLLKETDSEELENYLSYEDLFPTESSDKTIPDGIKDIFSGFYKDFSYQIKKVEKDGSHALVTVQLTTIDGKQLAKNYSQQAMRKQIQNTATPSSVSFSLEDCYLLLGKVLKDQPADTVTSLYTISLTRSDKVWSIDAPGDLTTALTGNFSSHVSDVNLFTPSEIISIHLDTLKEFDSEQLSRYLNLDSIFTGDAEYRRTISRALAAQLLTYLDYSILSEEISADGVSAVVQLELTSCDCRSMMSNYQTQVAEYTQTAQALQDGIGGRLTRANQILISCITENTASTSTPVTITMKNDGANWTMEMNDEVENALLGNLPEAINEVSTHLQN